MRHSATRAILERDDVIIVASVSCIYGIGSVETYTAMTFSLAVGEVVDERRLMADLVALQYKRNDAAFTRGTFRRRGDMIEIFPAHYEDRAWRVSLFGEEVESIVEFDPLTGKKTADLPQVKIYANSHYVTPAPDAEAGHRPDQGRAGGAAEVVHRNRQAAGGAAAGAAHPLRPGDDGGHRLLRRHRELQPLSDRAACPASRRRPCSSTCPRTRCCSPTRATSPCRRSAAMYKGDLRRKTTLAEYGFRLPSCMDNRPLKFEEWDAMRPQTVHVSATPRPWEMEQHRRRLRRAGDPPHRPDRPAGGGAPGQPHARGAQLQPGRRRHRRGARRWRCAAIARLVTVLTKKMAEDLTEYMHEQGVRVRYMHSDVDTVERIEIIRDLRLGAFDVLVGINLLREGLDIPECAFVAILDADKEGFLRSETSPDPDHRPGGAQRRRPGDPLRRPHHRLDGAGHGRDRAPAREAGRLQRRARHHAREREARHRRHPGQPVREGRPGHRGRRRGRGRQALPRLQLPGHAEGPGGQDARGRRQPGVRDRRAPARRDQAAEAARPGVRQRRHERQRRRRGGQDGGGSRPGPSTAPATQNGPSAAGRSRPPLAEIASS